LITALLLQSCDTDSLFVLTPRDFFGYVLICALIGVLVAMRSNDKRRKTFWMWFLISLLLTPIAGVAYLVFTFTSKAPKAE
jgi:hypothetical protein